MSKMMKSGKRKHISQRQNLISRNKNTFQNYRKSFPPYNYTAQQVVNENKDSFSKIIKRSSLYPFLPTHLSPHF